MYPDDEVLGHIESWKFDDAPGWFDYIEEHLPDYGRFTRDSGVIEIATGGWSGCEDIINAMSSNICLWNLTWLKSERGGLHTFEVPVNE